MAGSIDELFKDAMASLNAGRPDDAERHFKALLRLQPNNIAALNILGAVLASSTNMPRPSRICVPRFASMRHRTARFTITASS